MIPVDIPQSNSQDLLKDLYPLTLINLALAISPPTQIDHPNFKPVRFILPKKELQTFNKQLRSIIKNKIDQQLEQLYFVQFFDWTSCCTKSFSVSSLLLGLSKIRIEDPEDSSKSKMVNLIGLDQISEFCESNGLALKQICMCLLIQKMDKETKTIKYRAKVDVYELIKDLIRQIIDGKCFLWVRCKQDQNKGNTSAEVKKLLTILQTKEKNSFYQWNEIEYSCEQNRVLSCNCEQELKQVAQKQKSELVVKTFYHKISRRFVLQIKELMKGSLIAKVLKNFILALIIKSANEKSSIQTMEKFARSYIQSNNFKYLIKQNSVTTISKYFYAMRCVQRLKGIRQKHHSSHLENKVKSFSTYLLFCLKSKCQKVQVIQRHLRTYLSNLKVVKQRQNQYLSFHKQMSLKNRILYNKGVHEINKILQKKQGYLAPGIYCHLNILHMESWSNCDLFSPEKITNFFFKVIAKGDSIVKISVENTELKIIRGDGNVYAYGVSEPSIPHGDKNDSIGNHFSDFTSELKIDSNGYLSARGDNTYGQLGIGNRNRFQKQWTKVKVKDKARLFHSFAKKSMCLTTNNDLYIWGSLSSGIQDTPKLIKISPLPSIKEITSLKCSHIGFYVITSESEIFNIQTGQLIKKVFTNPQTNLKFNEKMLISVGNNAFEVLYFVGLAIQSYDLTKKKSVIRWFKRIYDDERKKNEDNLLQSDCISDYKTAASSKYCNQENNSYQANSAFPDKQNYMSFQSKKSLF